MIMLCGLPGSGKSAYALKMAKKEDMVIHSSDKLRKELGVDVGDRTQNQKLFSELHKRIKEDLKNSKSVIYDACNINYKQRMGFLNELKRISCYKECVVIATSYEDCLIDNQKRGMTVPKEVITKMYKQWTTPYIYEGWDEVRLRCRGRNYLTPGAFILNNRSFEQENQHHLLSLGDHCGKAAGYINSLYPDRQDLIRAAMLHDCGKPFTKSYLHSNGNITEEACYYNHQNVGAYDSLFYMAEDMDSRLYGSVLIQFHMHPYFWEQQGANTEKLKNKYRKLWGEEMYQDIIDLHNADVAAH